MVNLRAQIQDYLREHKQATTSQLVLHIFEEAPMYEQILVDSQVSSQKKKQAKQELAKLHRKLLYYLQKLDHEHCVQVVKRVTKGQHVYELIEQTPTRQDFQSTYISEFESKRWQLYNALLLDCMQFDSFDQALDSLCHYARFCNDVLGLNDFETLLEKDDTVTLFYQRLIDVLAKHHISASIIIDATNILDEKKVLQFIRLYVKYATPLITLVFDVTAREFVLHKSFFSLIASEFAQHGLKFNIKNDDVHQAPYFVGRAGPYTIDPQEWKSYIQQPRPLCAVICQKTLLVDLAKFFQEKTHARDLESVFHECSYVLFDSLTRQGAHFSDPNMYVLSDVRIRLLHHFYIPSDYTFEQMATLLQECTQTVRHLAKQQEVIYNACGLLLRYKLHISQAYRLAAKQSSLLQPYTYLQIQAGKQLLESSLQKQLHQKELIVQAFEGGFEVRIKREGVLSSSQAFGECSLVLNSFAFPFFCYSFSLQTKERALSEFLEDD
ncbi:MAG: hypothetical protein ACMXYF_03840 [Candidatus Woesearchaeota archaeon]